MSDAVVASILDRMRAEGGRVTTSRVAVVEAIVRGPAHHLTAADLVEQLRAVNPTFQESTVYRTLDRLVSLGAMTRIEVDGGPAVFHLAHSAHHHVVCEACGKVVGVQAELLASVARRLHREYGFELRADAVTLPGRCVDCEPESAESTKSTASHALRPLAQDH